MMKKTPLHTQHQQLGARMGEFGGWDMPIQYAGILDEHDHTRNHASVFDICHMGEFELYGKTALRDLEHLLTCNIRSLKIGQVRYGFMLNEAGGVMDDLTCYRLDENRYMLVVNAGTLEKDAEWIQSHLSAETIFVDLSAETAKLDVQGPESRDVLEEVFGCTLPELEYFRFKEFHACEASTIISRTGYTGELGYEIYLPNDAAIRLWEKLVAHPYCEPAGLGARDTLRLEMGYALYGHELNEERSPSEMTRGLFIDRNKQYIGKQRVMQDLGEPQNLLVGLRFQSKRAAREGDKVFSGDREIGVVTSGSLAPSLGVAVAMGYVEHAFSRVGKELEVEIRGRRFPAEIVDLPFYKKGTARVS
ncbi:glycine cleavage system aminomethyltransferase GcvT [Pontiella agarivorans]|uniref:Aminomethyltransferase n=1 Tax=Pontiella agarivorans TaxID=3038953 RepID=A0ABU5MT45_9BACT|nr:glycine cleavage system aminomethyltransferase GcvT [Pontiella agarivorans]MDZ8117370.1 glycine cleavage system aminomethyltransferase GcvT [Pontiella agarivorans]